MGHREPTNFITTGPVGNSQRPEEFSQRFSGLEPFVDADLAAEFLSVKRKTILDWARAGSIPAHRYGRGNKAVWRFRISEIASHGQSAHSTMEDGSPEMARLEEEYG
jgi:excisionase family DNA binding protein